MSAWMAANPTAHVFVFALLTALATSLGALPFLFIRTVSAKGMALANAIAAGLMLGASFGLLVEGTRHSGWATFLGTNFGVLFILVTQRLLGGNEHEAEFLGVRGAGAQRMLLVIVIMTVHSFAEGAAVGVSFGGGTALAAAITLAVAVHNIPEGLAISAVMRPQGASLLSCAWWSLFSSLPQPIAAVPAFLFVAHIHAALPYGLGFAAGAMLFMVLVELLPEAYQQAWSRTVGLVTALTLIAMLVVQRYF
ncbi:MAG TPA: ZIP family metal transporter [Gemmatimonadaceae bacterium]|nr:ZIP family metal transporter [Gemmatimonadaceae bacterium]